MIINYLTFALLLVQAQDTTRPPVFSPFVLQRADSIAEAEYAKDSLGSVTVGIVSGPNLVWTRSYGFSDSARTIKANANTVYRIASVSKQFTALMLLHLVERNRLSLADPVERFFPEIRQIRKSKSGGAPVTFLQLATMTAGLARDPDDKRASATGTSDKWLETLIRALPKTEYVRQPGTGYGYSNIGYSILAAALGRAARESYTRYVQTQFLMPLGMQSSGFVLTDDLARRLATGVDFDELVKGHLNYADASKEHMSGIGLGAPSGGLYSTVGDIAKLISFEIGSGPDNILRRETLKLREDVPIAANASLGYGYGLGFQAYRWADTVAVGHSGNLAGYTSMVLYDTKLKYGVIVLRSAAGGEADAGRLAGRVFRRLRYDATIPARSRISKLKPMVEYRGAF